VGFLPAIFPVLAGSRPSLHHPKFSPTANNHTNNQQLHLSNKVNSYAAATIA
jgi:hypothetical protein